MLCLDEKTQVQAPDLSQPVLPMTPGMPERRTCDYAGTGHQPVHRLQHRRRHCHQRIAPPPRGGGVPGVPQAGNTSSDRRNAASPSTLADGPRGSTPKVSMSPATHRGRA